MKHTAARTRRAVLRASPHPHAGPHTALPAPGHGPGHRGAHARAHAGGPVPALSARVRARTKGAVLGLTGHVRQGLQEAWRRPDRGDISTTTVIIWVAAVGGAILIAGTIAVVLARYNGILNGL
ncbi:hypothetical protein RKD23_008030 [Streptomyces sp. SAI-170]|uniref:hypothetical protein n=1 Tax=Streptomyces sp. SAI-170 TaxID=3377729 RepID=UPI003C7C4AA5